MSCSISNVFSNRLLGLDAGKALTNLNDRISEASAVLKVRDESKRPTDLNTDLQ